MRATDTNRVERDDCETTAVAEVDHDDRLILWMLERTPAQRLEALQNFAEGVVAIRHARKISS